MAAMGNKKPKASKGKRVTVKTGTVNKPMKKKAPKGKKRVTTKRVY